jgi:hypothetical protein
MAVMKMADKETADEKLKEVKCLRAVLERILRVMDEGLFVDYQMEKFGKIGYADKDDVVPLSAVRAALEKALPCERWKTNVEDIPCYDDDNIVPKFWCSNCRKRAEILKELEKARYKMVGQKQPKGWKKA